MPKPALSPSRVHSLLVARLGAVDDFRPIAEGLDSQAFAFRREGEEYVVRIRRSIEGFRKERLVHDHFCGRLLPIPAVTEIGRFDGGHAYCISELLPGVRLHAVDAGRLAGLTDVALELMDAIATAAAGRVAGFGSFDERGRGAYASWRDYLASFVEGDRLDWRRLYGSVEMSMIEEMRRLVDVLSPHCPEEQALIHGDFGSYNLLTDGQRITAVIDWDRAAFGDPLYDVANLLFWREEILHPLIERVAERRLAIPQWAERTFCYQLCIGLHEIYDSATGATPFDLAWLTERSIGLLEEWPPSD